MEPDGHDELAPVTGLSDGKPLHWMAVIQSLGRGELDLLAIYLRQTSGKLDPAVATRLATMIDGPVSKTGWRLRVGRHPKLSPNARGPEQRFVRWRKDMHIASYMARHGATDPGGFDASVAAAKAHFKLSRTTITGAWTRYGHLAKRKELAFDHYGPRPVRFRPAKNEPLSV